MSSESFDKNFIENLTTDELHIIVATWMGDDPVREGYTLVYPDYSGDWREAGRVLEHMRHEDRGWASIFGMPWQCRVLFSNGEYKEFCGTCPRTVLTKTVACIAVQEMPKGYLEAFLVSQMRPWSWKLHNRDGITLAFNTEEAMRLDAWRHFIDTKMALRVARGERC